MKNRRDSTWPGGSLLLLEDLFWKPLNIPLTDALRIPDDHLERIEIKGGNGVEGNVEEDERPLEEGISGVGCSSVNCQQFPPTTFHSALADNTTTYPRAHGGLCAE